MAFDISRRSLFLGGLLTLAAPAVVRASSIMPIRDPRLVRGIILARNKFVIDENGKSVETRAAFAPLAAGYESHNHETMWLRQDDPLVREYHIVADNTVNLTGGDALMNWAAREGRQRDRPHSPIYSRFRRQHNVDFAAAVRKSLKDTHVPAYRMTSSSDIWPIRPKTYFDRYREHHA